MFSVRNRGSGWIRNEVTRNPWIWGAVVVCLALILTAVYWPPLARLLSVENPGISGWGVAILASLVPLIVGQLVLLSRPGSGRDATDSGTAP